MQRIVLLASYPKSGNTWLRAFLSNLMGSSEDPVDINNFPIPWGIARPRLDQILGVKSSDLTTEEIWSYLPSVYKRIASTSSRSSIFLKTHSMSMILKSGESLFPADALKGVVYLVRNPLDVCASFAHHSGWEVDHTVSVMEDSEFRFFDSGNHLHPVAAEKVSSWSVNVMSWVNRLDVPTLVVRYEDILSDPHSTFTGIVRFCGMNASARQIDSAITHSEFANLKRQENENGFHEKNPVGPRFFRRGHAGGWRQELSTQQIKSIIRGHGPVMSRLGYEGI
ncbi:sulfotransferase domain-containing protein [Pseudomonadota bacterium]